MSFLILPNTAGNSASSMDAASSGTIASGYTYYDAIAGPRSTRVRMQAITGANRIGYHFAADLTVDYCVVARADWLLTAGTMRVRPFEKSSGGSWSASSAVDYNPLTSANLRGVTSQDLVFAMSPTNKRGYALEADTVGGTAEAMLISKLFFATSFNIGPPDQSPVFQTVADNNRYILPATSTQPYAVERRFTLTWSHMTTAAVSTFRALPRLLGWPLYLYDTTGDTFPWELEHVLIESYQENRFINGSSNLQVVFLRLEHYP